METRSGITDRAESLDVLRGIAAVTVMLSHARIAFSPAINAFFGRWSPASIVMAGHQAVILFFVLSGFALTCMIKNMRSYSYPNYLFARVFRLYPTYAISIIFTLILFGILAGAGYQWEYGW